MSLKEQMRKYILANDNPPSYKQMIINLKADPGMALEAIFELIDEGFCQVLPAEGVLYVFQSSVTTEIKEISDGV